MKYRALNELCDRAFKAEVRWCRAAAGAGAGAAAAQRGSWANEHDSEGALTVSLLTQSLVQFCHLWMVPACCLGLMAGRRQKNETKAEEFHKVAEEWRCTFSGQKDQGKK